MFDKIELGKRLTEIRTDFKLNSRQFALSIKADPSYYAKAEKGEGISDEYLQSIINTYNCNKNWLLFGEGEKKGGVNVPRESHAFNLNEEGVKYGVKNSYGLKEQNETVLLREYLVFAQQQNSFLQSVIDRLLNK